MSPSSNGSEPQVGSTGVPGAGSGADRAAPGDQPLAGRVAVVTGGGRGIGRAIARRLRDAGASVLVCGRRAPDPLPEGIAFTVADVREPDQAHDLVQEAVRRFGRLDIVVNNAGGSPAVPAATASANLVTAVVRLNLLAPFFVAQAANAVMQRQADGGLILNIGSVSATRPAPGTAAYAAAKAGLAVLTQALAVEWAPAVRVNCVTAGLVRTEQTADHYGDEDALAAVAATVPLGRMATPDDIADACLLLTSPLAGYVTGANLVVDGGGQRPAYADAARPAPGTRPEPD
ncbi:SDR family oxidoreductase [Micromonospora echinospora]|uniref:SDR family oxidoreductase n=1 Tax=Micromonospora echinospora TaxID=1877 RepID=UPI003A8A86F1